MTEMYLLLRSLLTRTIVARRTFTSDVSKTNAEKWDLFAGVSLERLPIITRQYNEHEEKIHELLSLMEFEKSYKSKFEVRLENDLKRMKDLKEGKTENLELDSAPQQTGQDYLDSCNEELKSFTFGSREIDEKIENNIKSTKRALDRRLLLLIQETIGEKQIWVLPQGKYQGEESLRHTAERVLKEKCGTNLNAKFLGNCPCGYYNYKYPKHARNDTVGAKIFFFKALLEQGYVDENICPEFHWATRKELVVLPEKYYKSINQFLLDENH